jgi:predicted Zn-dependent peptidase
MRSERSLYALGVLLLVTTCPGARAKEIALDVRELTLKNGMKVLVLPRKDTPTVSTYLRFKSGSAQEPARKTGLSHMLEHMMFKGTRQLGTVDPDAEDPILNALDRLHQELARLDEAEHSPFGPKDPGRRQAVTQEIAKATSALQALTIPNELWEIYRRHGAVGLNATTSRDGTQYFVSLPSNRLDLWALIESDRIRNPVFREFYTERAVVREERRQRYESNPEGALYEALFAAAYVAHPYRNPVIGWPSDIDSLLRPDALRHFKTHYAPNNAVAVLVGDLDADRVGRLMEERFGSIPSQPLPDARLTREPPQRGERRVAIRFDSEPRMMIGYHVPALGHADTYALQVAVIILGGGRTSRFYRALIDGARVASSIETYVPQLSDPGLLIISAAPRAPHTPADLEKGIDEEIERMKEAAVSEDELARVRNRLEANLIRSLRSNASLAAQLGNAQALAGDWRYVLEAPKRLKAVTADEVQRVLKTYLTPNNRTVATLVPLSP